MAKQLYAPLVFIEKCNKYGGYSEKNLKDNYYDHFLKDVIHIPKDKLPSIDWIIKYALSNKFMKSCKHHAEECMDDICHTELIIQLKFEQESPDFSQERNALFLFFVSAI